MLRWQSRRGMKELDVLLERFIQIQSIELDQDAWPELETLLAMEDDQLWDLIQDPAAATGEYQFLLKQISHVLAQSG
ncbi:MAG TPA: succinate dehydrogenase assembly factor 2 [Xanthomonadales bacterium]|nr:succinate dehydrogenase assembly factor 2 [Xanthomonadales bacterium]